MKEKPLKILRGVARFFPKPIGTLVNEVKIFFKRLYSIRIIPIFLSAKKKKLVLDIAGKNRVRVVFLVIHKNVWKVDTVFQKMHKDPYFDPVILVCPYVQFGRERMLEELNETYKYFASKGYPVYSSLNPENNKWLSLDELKPDILFFTNPHSLTRSEYYSDAYKKYLSVYVPYYFMATTHAGDDFAMYGTPFLSSMFTVFWPSNYHLEQQVKTTSGFVKNGAVTGYPAMEGILEKSVRNQVWKLQEKEKKKIIFAPHHTIDEGQKSLTSFLTLASFMQRLALQLSDQLQWSFKPHPILKAKLLTHPEWGQEKTEEYYEFWRNNSFTQLDEGEYSDLFKESDAIIHNSSSFIAEYAFLEKPGLYILDQEKVDKVVNPFGKMFLEQYLVTDSEDGIKVFLKQVIQGGITVKNNADLTKYITECYIENRPSDLVIKHLKKAFLR